MRIGEIVGRPDNIASGPADAGRGISLRLPLLGVAGRIFAALIDPKRQNHAVLGVLAVYVLVWTLYGVIAKSTQDIHPDTGELLIWSNELALGYWKHPPFGVYVVKLWTTIFPVA